jgi:hypothetical protein
MNHSGLVSHLKLAARLKVGPFPTSTPIFPRLALGTLLRISSDNHPQDSPLQRVRELQKKASIPNDLVAGSYTACNLCLATQVLTQRDGTSAKLVRRDLRIDKRLVLAVPKECGIR